MILTYILVALAVAAIAFVTLVATRPSDMRVTRSAAISAPPPVVFEQVNNLRNWDAWSPWAKLDPNINLTFQGPDAGDGASYAWTGNSKVGQGRMTITDSRPHEFIRFRLEFLKPFKATNTAEFTFAPQGDRTNVTWTMLGNKNFLMKAFGLFMDCDKMIGNDFEKGLAQLKTVAEASPGTQHREYVSSASSQHVGAAR